MHEPTESSTTLLAQSDIAALAVSSGSLTGYLGRKKDWVEAQNAAQSAAQAHARAAAATSASDAAMDSVISAALTSGGQCPVQFEAAINWPLNSIRGADPSTFIGQKGIGYDQDSNGFVNSFSRWTAFRCGAFHPIIIPQGVTERRDGYG